jgi:tetratricopeptide (TPR) repeat protein
MNFKELEKKCKRRRLKIKLFYAASIILFLLSILATYFVVKKFLFSNNEVEVKKAKVNLEKKENKAKPKKEKQEKEIEVKEVEHQLPKKKADKKPTHTDEFKVIDPQMFNEESNEKMRGDVFIKPDLSFLKQPKKYKKPKKVLESKPITFEECIKKAQKYYNEKKYLKALEWAKNANLIDKDDPRSWIITAKALNKMGKKDEAVEILKIYYSYHKNEEVKKLIGELQ